MIYLLSFQQKEQTQTLIYIWVSKIQQTIEWGEVSTINRKWCYIKQEDKVCPYPHRITNLETENWKQNITKKKKKKHNARHLKDTNKRDTLRAAGTGSKHDSARKHAVQEAISHQNDTPH